MNKRLKRVQTWHGGVSQSEFLLIGEWREQSVLSVLDIALLFNLYGYVVLAFPQAMEDDLDQISPYILTQKSSLLYLKWDECIRAFKIFIEFFVFLAKVWIQSGPPTVSILKWVFLSYTKNALKNVCWIEFRNIYKRPRVEVLLLLITVWCNLALLWQSWTTRFDIFA